MKKAIFIFSLLLLVLSSCKKKMSEETFEERLEGNWKLVSVQYSGTAPNPLNPTATINFDGEGQNVQGGLEMHRNPYKVDYDFSFTANVALSDTTPAFPVDIDQSGSGTWTTTSDESTIIITEENQTYNFDVLTNEPDRQVLHTTITQTVFQFVTVNSDVELEFVRE